MLHFACHFQWRRRLKRSTGCAWWWWTLHTTILTTYIGSILKRRSSSRITWGYVSPRLLGQAPWSISHYSCCTLTSLRLREVVLEIVDVEALVLLVDFDEFFLEVIDTIEFGTNLRKLFEKPILGSACTDWPQKNMLDRLGTRKSIIWIERLRCSTSMLWQMSPSKHSIASPPTFPTCSTSFLSTNSTKYLTIGNTAPNKSL